MKKALTIILAAIGGGFVFLIGLFIVLVAVAGVEDEPASAEATTTSSTTTTTRPTTTTTERRTTTTVFLALDDQHYFSILEEFTDKPWLTLCMQDQESADGCADTAFGIWKAVGTLLEVIDNNDLSCDSALLLLDEGILAYQEGYGSDYEEASWHVLAAISTWYDDSYIAQCLEDF